MIAMQYGSGSAAGKAVGLRMDLLWENDDLSSNFAAQTVQVDLSSYSHYLVVPVFSKANQNTSPGVLNVAEDGIVCGLVVGSGTNNNVGSRTCYYDSSVPGIVFAGGNYGGSSHNDYCIPKAIYGVKTGSGSSSGGGGGGGGGSGVASVNGMTGIVILGAADVGAVPSGQGVPSGGTTGQVLAKASGTDYDLTWTNGGGGSTEIYWATYGSTTAAEIYAELSAGKLVLCEYNYNVFVLAEYDDQNDYAGFFCGSNGYRVWLTVNNGTWARSASMWPTVATATPQDLGTAAVGTATKYAREDHVHNKPTPAGIGAIAAPASPTAGDFLVWDGSAWTAMSMSTWQGGNY